LHVVLRGGDDVGKNLIIARDRVAGWQRATGRHFGWSSRVSSAFNACSTSLDGSAGQWVPASEELVPRTMYRWVNAAGLIRRRFCRSGFLIGRRTVRHIRGPDQVASLFYRGVMLAMPNADK
jgi:hypothetical protein